MASVRRALTILDLLADAHTAAGPSELAAALGCSRAAVQQHLATLTELGWTERTDAGAYRLTLRTSLLGHAALRQAGLGERVLPAMRRLVDRVQEVATLIVLDGTVARIVERVAAPRTVQAGHRVDTRLDLRTTASGRVLTAFAAPGVVAALRAGGTPVASEAELREIVRRGYATSIDDAPDEAVAAAVPVRDEGGVCVAALAIVAPAHRFALQATVAGLRETLAELDGLWR